MPNRPENVRNECYGRIVQSVRQRAERYYASHPERLDARGDQELIELSHLLADLLNILDDYQVTRRPSSKSG